MTVSEAKKRANKKWDKANMKHYGVAVPLSEAEKIDQYCEENKLPKSNFFRQAAKEKIEREK